MAPNVACPTKRPLYTSLSLIVFYLATSPHEVCHPPDVNEIRRIRIFEIRDSELSAVQITHAMEKLDVKHELLKLIEQRRWRELRNALTVLHPSDAAEALAQLDAEHQGVAFRLLPRGFAFEVFTYLGFEDQERLIRSLSNKRVRALLTEMTPDDRTHLLQELPAAVTRQLLATLSAEDRYETRALLAYPEETAGRYMTPDYVSLHPGMNAAEALEHIRLCAAGKETINVLYVLDDQGHFVYDLSLASLVLASPETKVSEIHHEMPIAVRATDDREDVLSAFEKYDRIAMPVTDKQGHMLGIITVDDVLDVAEAEATEDFHKIGGLEPLEIPYTRTGIFELLRKRAGWLAILFLGEMLTATAMGYFEHEIARAVVLALFVPLIISTGGNSGSQAASLIIRAVAVRELRSRDWFYVFRRELISGVLLGSFLGALGFSRITFWHRFGLANYGEHYVLVAATVWISLVGVVCFGTLAGSMLPLLLHRFGLDPATSSAPFVATLVDVTGLVLYFVIAQAVLRGTLL